MLMEFNHYFLREICPAESKLYTYFYYFWKTMVSSFGDMLTFSISFIAQTNDSRLNLEIYLLTSEKQPWSVASISKKKFAVYDDEL